MKIRTQIEALWANLSTTAAVGSAVLRVDEQHSLDILACWSIEGKPGLILLSLECPAAAPRFQSLHISTTQRSDGTWATLFELSRKEFAPFFALVSQDLIDSSRDVPKANGASFIFGRLERWRRLMDPGKRQVLAESELRGLLAELHYLLRLAIPRWGLEQPISGWVGPMGAAQDFSLGDMLIEVKSYRPGSGKVAISSLRQLTSDGVPLVLTLVPLTSADQAFDGAFTPWQLVEEIRHQIESLPASRSEFELRLAERGFHECDEYKSMWYHAGAARHYRVGDGFPRITRSAAPAGVIDATYEIEIAACEAFEVQFGDEQ